MIREGPAASAVGAARRTGSGAAIRKPSMPFTVSLPPTDERFCVVARRNDSLAPRQRWTAYGAFAAGSLGLAFALAAGGIWPVLPYAALELSCLAIAFLLFERRSRDVDRLAVEGDRVVVETERGGRANRREFRRQWLRVEVDLRGWTREPRLVLRSGRDEVPFGDALAAGERTELARTIRGALRGD